MIIAHNQLSQQIIINYLNKNNLFSSKQNDFFDWYQIYQLQLKKEHLTIEGQLKCKQLKANFNNKRKDVSWKHLTNFYLS